MFFFLSNQMLLPTDDGDQLSAESKQAMKEITLDNVFAGMPEAMAKKSLVM